MMRWKVYRGYNIDKLLIDSYSLDKCIFVNVKGISYIGVYLLYSILII